jgi:diguanylate cyclase (GGDEF)-like protein
VNGQQISRIIRMIERLHRRTLIAILVLSMSALIVTDLVSSPTISLTMLYLAPITFCAWYISARLSQVLVVVCAIVELIDGLVNNFSPTITLWNAAIRLIFFLLFVALLTNLRDSYRREHTMARSDPLTGVFNRRAFHDLLEHELARMRRIAIPLTIAYLDLDNFKAINDLLGHSVGDELLIHLTTLMRGNLRTIDRVARLGGDEFVILMPATDAPAADVALTRLKATIQDSMRARHWPVTLSIGAVALHEVPDTIDQVISLADHTMYGVKRSGKDSVQVIAWGHQPVEAHD